MARAVLAVWLRGSGDFGFQIRQSGRFRAWSENPQKSECNVTRMDPSIPTQTSANAASAASELKPQPSTRPVWIRIPEATRLFGPGRSTIYALIAEGKIRSRVLKTRRDAQSGIRLVSYDSLNALIAGEEGGKE